MVWVQEQPNKQMDRTGSPERTHTHLDKIGYKGGILTSRKTMEFLIKDAGTIGYSYAKIKIRCLVHNIYEKKVQVP